MDDQQLLASIAARRHVVFVPVSLELAEELERGQSFSGQIKLERDDDRPGEAELIFRRD